LWSERDKRYGELLTWSAWQYWLTPKWNWRPDANTLVIACVPLWTLFLVAVALMTNAWRVHVGARRDGHACPSCGYDLSGLPPGSACPECAAVQKA
jgi:hypothetical protein